MAYLHIYIHITSDVLLQNISAIHTTLYRVSYIKYTWLFVNAQFYAVLCISHSKCIFLAFKQFDSAKPTLFLKNIWKDIHIFFHSHILIAWNQYNFWKHMKKICITVSDFYMKTINNKHTLLYNLPTIHSIQRYYDLCELTNSFWQNLIILLLKIIYPRDKIRIGTWKCEYKLE